ncbi:MAG TPA: ADP-ribosylglycohydrolase family protein [archaeon]|nr:ADP-ribosylglycohydrolase family protein [archaeon]
MMKIEHLFVSRETLRIEREQLIDEGRDISSLQEKFDRFLALKDKELESRQDELLSFLDATINLPFRPDYPFYEPSDLESIQDGKTVGYARFVKILDDDTLRDRIHGAWLGRIAGCLLGKPVEGWDSQSMWGCLKQLNRYPLNDYFRSDTVPAELAKKYEISPKRGFIDLVDHMVMDDDLNYTVAGMLIVKKHGKDFTPLDVAQFWLENIPALATWTAERTAYRNFLNGVSPPDSAWCRNPYREWIGAQIRADAYGYLALGNPELAAEYAWRDASVSHFMNGIYGSMWVAAMLAEAPFLEFPVDVIEAGLAEIPVECRLAGAIKEVLGWHSERIGFEEAIARIHRKWDEKNAHHRCHTISNASIVALGLLWGEGDFEKSVCRAVQACFDTDCNGATVGSIVGIMLGAGALPEKWIAPLNNKLETSIPGCHLVEIDKLAHECFELYRSIREA